MPSMVLLRHDEPGGGHHYDWMLERPHDACERRLVTFRVHLRVDQLSPEAATSPHRSHPSLHIDAQRLADHRARYLGYQGEISGGRGTVRRLARGECWWFALAEGRLEASLAWAGSPLRWRLGGEAAGQGLWRLVLDTENSR